MPLDGLYGWISFTLIPLRTADGKRLVQAQLLGYALSAYAGSELGSDSSSSSSSSAAAVVAIEAGRDGTSPGAHRSMRKRRWR